MFIVSKRKYDERVEELTQEINDLNLEVFDEVKAKRKIRQELDKTTKDLNNKISEVKQQNIIISQYEMKAKKDNEKIEKLEKTVIDLQNDNMKKDNKILDREILRRKAAGKVGGLKAALIKKTEEAKSLSEIISKQEEEIKKLKCRISPPTKQELENYKLFGNKNGRRKIK